MKSHNYQQQEQQQQQQQQKGLLLLSSPKWHVISTFSHFLLFACGVAAGVILNSYIKNLSFDLHVNTNDLSISPPPSSPNSPLIPSSQINKLPNNNCGGGDQRILTIPTPTHHDHHSSPPPPPTGRVGLSEFLKINPAADAVMHDMEEDELLWRASMVPKVKLYPFPRLPKVAFLFLTKGPVLLTPMWELFFKGVHPSLYSIYVHSSPSYVPPPNESPLFRSRRIPSKAVQWGKFNMMEAERRLLANALLDMSNQRFVLLSESCIPLFNFSTVYTYLINSRQVYVEAYDSPAARTRYTTEMLPEMKVSQWRKGSQWFEMDRDLAVEVVSDNKYFTKLQSHCKDTLCYVDEHYLPTYFGIEHWDKNSNRSLTWVDWSNGGIHPNRYVRGEVTADFLEKLRSGSECLYNGDSTTTCFLFARKFLTTSLVRLLRYAPKVMHFNS